MIGGGRILALVLCLIVVAGCAPSVSGSASPLPTVDPPPPSPAVLTPVQDRPLPRIAPPVLAPKDARGIGSCDLLTAAQLMDLGLQPDTARPSGSDTARSCSWLSSEAGNPAGLQVNADSEIPALDGLYLVRDTFAVFEPIEVAGYPAVHADGHVGPVCTIYTAVSDYQVIATDGNLGGRPLPDPCAPSRRMAELILSNLPPLR